MTAQPAALPAALKLIGQLKSMLAEFEASLVDPYAELKAAQKTGKKVEVLSGDGVWRHYANYNWDCKPECYRIVPPAPWSLPPPPAGREWHRTDWTQDMLPDGWRPLLLGEYVEAEDHWKSKYTPTFVRNGGRSGKSVDKYADLNNYARTRRPFPPAPHPEPRACVPWDCPEDVPGPVCWLRVGAKIGETLTVRISESGVICWRTYLGEATFEEAPWELLKEMNAEYSTDRINWQPCTKPAPAGGGAL